MNAVVHGSPLGKSAAPPIAGGADWLVATLGLTGEQNLEVFSSDDPLTAPGAATAASNLADPGLTVGVGDLSTIVPETIDPALQECLRRKIAGFYYLEQPIGESSVQQSSSQQSPVQKPSVQNPSRVTPPTNARTVPVAAGAGSGGSMCADDLAVEIRTASLLYDADIAACDAKFNGDHQLAVAALALTCCGVFAALCGPGAWGCCVIAGTLCGWGGEYLAGNAWDDCRRGAASKRRAALVGPRAAYLTCCATYGGCPEAKP